MKTEYVKKPATLPGSAAAPAKPEGCGSCKFLRGGLCHRFPGAVVLKAGSGGGAVMALPEKADTDWCGEYRPA